MTALDLDTRYGICLNRLPGITLGTVNLLSPCGLHCKWRGAIPGHVTLFEMTSMGPNAR